MGFETERLFESNQVVNSGKEVKKTTSLETKEEKDIKVLESFADLSETMEFLIETGEKVQDKQILKQGFDVFKKSFFLFSKEEQKNILTILKQEEKRDQLEIYFVVNGYPNNISLKEFFYKFLGNKYKEQVKWEKQVKSEKEQVKSEKEQVKSEKEQVNKEIINEKIKAYKEIYNKNKQYIGQLGGIEFFDLLKQAKEKDFILSKADLERLMSSLEKPGELEKILDRLIEIDKVEGTNLYTEFKSNIVNLNPDFRKRIEIYEYEKNIISPKDLLKQAQIYSSIGTTKYKRDGDIIKSNDISIDLGETPPKRLIGKDYKLQTDLPVSDFYEATVFYEKTRIKIEPKINSLKGTIDYIDNLDIQNISLQNIKLVFRNILGEDLYNELGVGVINDKKEIKSTLLNNIIKRLNLYEKELKRAYEKYKKMLQAKVLSYKKSINEKDNEKREILKFLHNTCFDIIPQNFTDKLIAEIKLNSLIIPGLKINPKRIDIVNGNFGEADSEDNPTKWQENLIDFLNKMIYGEVNPKDSLLKKSSLIGPFAGNIDPEDFKALLQQKGIMGDSGMYFNIEKARENLSKKI